MFQLLLHPVVDLRPFLPDQAVARLTRPLWPTPTARQDFLRASGPVRPRLQGGVDEWAGEDNFASASMALRLPDQLRHQRIGTDEAPCIVSHVFRRFYCSGVVGRFEIGFRIQRDTRAALTAAATAQLIAACASLPVRLRGASDTRPLLTAGAGLARHFLGASTDRKAGISPQPWWVAAGQPALLIEYAAADGLASLPHARVVSSARVGAEVLQHAWLEIAGQRLSTWLLRRDAAGASPEELRKLRIHLVRLHCERECLRLVLEATAQQRLGNSLDQAHELNDYLDRTLPLVSRPTSHGVEQSQLLDVARTAWNAAMPGHSASFQALGDKASKKVSRYLRAAETAAPVITQIIGTQMNTHIQLGTVTVAGDFNLVTAQNIQNSFNKAAGAAVDEPLKEALKALTTQVAELAKRLPPEQAEAVSKDLSTLAAEAVSKEPRKRWYELSAEGLVDAAKTVAEMAAPVTTAVGAVLALLR